MTTENTAGPKLIYVSTYAKYNAGRLSGIPIDPTDHADLEEFLEACKAAHEDEVDPELMFISPENLPASLVKESSISASLWEFLALSEEGQKTVSVCWENVDDGRTIEGALESFEGAFASESTWAESYLEQTGGLSGVPAHLRGYIDFTSYARDAQLTGDMVFVKHAENVWAFRNN